MNSIDTFLLSESFMPSLTLEDVVRFSPFVARSLSAMHPGEDARACLAHFERIVEETFPREAMEAEAAAAADSQTLRMKLREMRRRLIVNIIGRNATGRIDYFEVVRLMSDFAETAVTATVKVNARELADMEKPEIQASFIHAKKLVAQLRNARTVIEQEMRSCSLFRKCWLQ